MRQGSSAPFLGKPERLRGPIVLVDHDLGWSEVFNDNRTRIEAGLGKRALRIEHVGSTSVPGLPAKPVIDIALEVPDSACESEYLPELEGLGYRLRIREPDWFEHRMLGDADSSVNLHVFSAACPETERMVRFRDRLRNNVADRDLYARAKRELAARDWTYMQQYADAKTEVIRAILART